MPYAHSVDVSGTQTSPNGILKCPRGTRPTPNHTSPNVPLRRAVRRCPTLLFDLIPCVEQSSHAHAMLIAVCVQSAMDLRRRKRPRNLFIRLSSQLDGKFAHSQRPQPHRNQYVFLMHGHCHEERSGWLLRLGGARLNAHRGAAIGCRARQVLAWPYESEDFDRE